MCRRWSENRCIGRHAEPGATLTDAVPTLRVGVRALRELSSSSLALNVPAEFTDDVEAMIGHWSAAAVHGDAMIRAAELEDQVRYDDHEARLDDQLRAGLRIAFELGATPCV